MRIPESLMMDVLVVEDDVDVVEVIVKHVERWGHKAETAATGKEALEKVRQKEFDLIVMDIFLPDIKGYDLIPKIKEVWHDIWIITLTGYNTRELELKVREQGIVYFMTKPFEAFALKAMLDHKEKKKNAHSSYFIAETQKASERAVRFTSS